MLESTAEYAKRKNLFAYCIHSLFVCLFACLFFGFLDCLFDCFLFVWGVFSFIAFVSFCFVFVLSVCV